MRRTIILTILLSIFYGFASAQYNPKKPPNTYTSKENPYYWKNKKPFPGYWQQDVHYMINAKIDEKTNIVDGELTLSYTNNSPDQLDVVYFHLYQNAFQPGSYNDALYKANGVEPKYGKYEGQGLGTDVEWIRVYGKDQKTELDNTILKVHLDKPIKPGATIKFDIKFKTYFDNGTVRRRMKTFNSAGFRHYDGVHWYPRISVYDRKFGWTTDQHLGREFYGDFGTFDVNLTFASNYIVEATGVLQNRQEVLPEDLRDKLDISNFADKPWGEKPSEIIPYVEGETKTWTYHAENVHDFAFTADPTYRIGEAFWNGVRCVSLVQESHASKWQNAAEYAAKTIEVFSNDFGMYAYPKIIVADARDGMEYPMLTLDGGSDPGFRGLLVHEIGHMWFFGMLGSNETYRAFMDEGFTQFLTVWGLEAIDGDTIVRDPDKSLYKRAFRKPQLAKDTRAYYGYLSAVVGEDDHQLNTHSDNFNGALRHGGGYRLVYSKTATMLYNLQYVLGDKLFQDAMKNYVATWSIAHPYPEDFRNSMIQYTKVDLNWFFDQWLETTKHIDYEVSRFKKLDNEGNYEILFKRNGRMQMPIDFSVVLDNGTTVDYHIPNTWFVKQTDATVLPKWHGWDNLNPTYTAKIRVNADINEVIIDPSERLADAYPPDNSTKTRIDFGFDHQVWNFPNRRAYELNWRPDVWYNGYDGIKIGLHFNGNYMRKKHVFSLTAWYNSRLAEMETTYEDETDPLPKDDPSPISFNASYRTSIPNIIKHGTLFGMARSNDGMNGWAAGIEQRVNKNNTLRAYLKSIWRVDSTELNYLLFQDEWQPAKYNNTLNFEWENRFRYSKGSGELNFDIRSGAILSDYNYSYIDAEFINKLRVAKFDLKSRLFGRFGTGNDPADESALFLSGANPEALMENKFTRSFGIIPLDWGGYGDQINYFHHGGGLNLRGYAGYYGVEVDPDSIQHLIYKGNSGIALNLELDFDKYFRIRNRWLNRRFGLDTYLFADAGTMAYEDLSDNTLLTDIRLDAGAGAALTIRRWGPLEMAKDLTVRFDVPFYISHAPYLEPDNVAFRWVVGVNRAF